MNFQELQLLIDKLVRTQKCIECGCPLTKGGFCIAQRPQAPLLLYFCHCGLSFSPSPVAFSTDLEAHEPRHSQPISADDVLDARKFLSTWKFKPRGRNGGLTPVHI